MCARGIFLRGSNISGSSPDLISPSLFSPSVPPPPPAALSAARVCTSDHSSGAPLCCGTRLPKVRVACGIFYSSGMTLHPALLENYFTIVLFFSLVVLMFVTLLLSTLHSFFVPVPLFKAGARRSLERKIEIGVFCVLLPCQMMVGWSTFHSMDEESRMVKGKVGMVFYFLALVAMLLVMVLGDKQGGAVAADGGGYKRQSRRRQ